MPNDLTEITCTRCGHTWYPDMAPFDKKDQTIYRGEKTEQRTYPVPCPRCGTVNVVTVRFEEQEDG
jgi:ribosomal protein L37E